MSKQLYMFNMTLAPLQNVPMERLGDELNLSSDTTYLSNETTYLSNETTLGA